MFLAYYSRYCTCGKKKHVRASHLHFTGCEFIELGLNVSRGSLDRGVPPSPSNPDPV